MFRTPHDKKRLTQVLHYSFSNEALLIQALTRRSALEEGRQERGREDFQRLEFIGDKVLGLIVADILLDCYPSWKEGRLTQETADLVRNKGPLALIAEQLSLIMGHGEELQGVRVNARALSDAMEALLGALWLDTGRNYSFMRAFIQKHWSSLGLLPMASYEQLIRLLHDRGMEASEKIQYIEDCLRHNPGPAVLHPFLLAVIEYTSSPLLIDTVLKKGIDPSVLTTLLDQQLAEECLPPLLRLFILYCTIGQTPIRVLPKASFPCYKEC